MKHVRRILVVLAVVIGLIAGSVALLLRSGRVQTAVIQLVTEKLSQSLGTDIRVERIKFRFLNRLHLDGVYISDQQGDTLLWIPGLDVRFNPISLKRNELDFTSVRLDEPYINLRQDTCGTNADFLIDVFSSDSAGQALDMPVRLRNVTVNQARLRYHYLPKDYDVRISPLDLQFALPVISGDSLLAEVDNLSVRAGLEGIDAALEASFHGSLDSLVADKILFSYRKKNVLTGKFRFNHPFEPELMQTGVECQDLYFNYSLLQDLLSDILRRPVQLPNELANLGDIHYRGHIGGRLENMVLNGAFITDIGSVSTHARLCADTSLTDVHFEGKVGTQHLRLHRLLPQVPIGDLSMQSNVNMHYHKGQSLDAQGEIEVQQFVFKDYTYKDIKLTAVLTNSCLQADLTSHDPNLDVFITGNVNLDKSNPSVDAHMDIKHLCLGNLNLVPQVEEQDMHMQARLNLSAWGDSDKWLDHLNGSLVADTFHLVNYGHHIALDEISLQIVNNDKENSLRCLSDYLNAHIKGQFSWTTLHLTLYDFAYALFPRMMKTPPPHHLPNDLDFYCYINRADSVLQALTETDIHLPQKQTIKGFIHESENEQGIQLFVPSLVSPKMEIKDITLSMVQQRDNAVLALSLIDHPTLNDSSRLKIVDAETNLLFDARHDSIDMTCNFSEIDAEHPMAEIKVLTRLDRYDDRPFVDVHVLPSSFYLRDTLWSLNDAYIDYKAADTTVTVRGFDLSCSSQFIRANGVASPRMTDSVRVDLRNISLGYIMRNFDLDKAITADGDMTGWVTLYSVLSQPMLEARLNLPQAYLNNTLLGELDATATLDRENNQVLIGGIAHQDNRTIVDLQGKVIPSEKYWELSMQLDSADLYLVNHWTSKILSDIGGRGYGWLGVYGRHYDTWVRARLLGKNACLTVPATQVRYTFTDSVIMDTSFIAFPHISVRDDDGHYGTLDGIVTHARFKDFAYDLRMNVSDMMVLNLPYHSQQRVYGKVYATGDAHLYGDETIGTRLDANAVTRGKSDFYFYTGVASEAQDNSFIDFVKDEQAVELVDSVPLPQRSNPFIMNLNLDVTPTANVHLLFNSRSGDGISGKGEGNLRMRWDALKSDVQLFGTYTLQQGLFSYTVANIIKRDFTIADGSTVIWSGNAVEPILNVTAKYAVTASLRDLFGNDVSQLTTNRTSVPVECLIYLNDKLSNPTLRFGIELPHSDETVSSQVKSVINSDEMLMRQVVYLLVFNRFFTPEYVQTTSTGLNDTYSLISSTVTGQINSWLSKITDMVTIGFNFRTDGEGSNASQEYETQFQIRPINRLSINGNVGYRYNDLSNRPFFGDVDIEYELTEDGKLRVKGFTHTVDKYSLKQANTVQGFGLIYRHDFNWGDARRKADAQRKQKQENKKEKQTK